MSMNAAGADRIPAILTDTTCDLPATILTSYGINVVPHRIIFGEKTYQSGVDITLSQVFESMQAEIPATSAPTFEEFKSHYAVLGRTGAPILSMHPSRGLSQTVTVAEYAARQMPDLAITPWDSRMISAGLGLLVLTAARAAKAGYTLAQILPLLEDAYQHIHFMFSMDDLQYLYRGGRIGRVSYQVARTLGIKPIVTISKEEETRGTYIQGVERPRSLKVAVDCFVRAVGREAQPGDPLRVLLLHGDESSREFALATADRLRERFNCVMLEIMPVTPVLAVHVGPKSFGIAFAAGDWAV